MSRPESSNDAADADITAMLLAWSGQQTDAPEALLRAVYDELHRQAARAMSRENEGSTLQATALVHEAYLRLVDQRQSNWRNRSHFFGISAQLMRRILVDHARGRLAGKRGGGQTPVSLNENGLASPIEDDSAIDVVSLHEALERLAQFDPDQARIVELRYFGGLTIEETAEVTGVSKTTVKSEWAIARAWLRRELTDA